MGSGDLQGGSGRRRSVALPTPAPCSHNPDKMLIQILGPGCSRCRAVAENARCAIADLGIDAKIEEVEDIQEIMRAGVLATPAVVVDGAVKGWGRVFSTDDLKGMIGG